jgi:o-succinylbenzoate---CoA ligase
MRELVALDMPAGTAVLRHVRDEWDNGNAALIVDQRLPHATKSDLLSQMGAHTVVTATDRTSLSVRHEPMVDGDALVVATSGSTGAPKGVVHTHHGLRCASLASAGGLRCGAEAHWLACLPLSHIGGFGVVTRAWHTGAMLTVHSGFDAEESMNAGATHVSLVATALRRVRPERFVRILLGGSRPPHDLPDNVTTTYGLTESCGGVVYDRRPLAGVEVAISPANEVLLRGPMLMRAYRNVTNPPAHPIDADGWLHTGDLGEFKDGQLHVFGRAGDLIITGGENVWPEQVENALRTHPRVADVVVAGASDPEWGQRVVAWVVPRDSAPSLEELRDHVSSTLPRFAALRQLVVVDQIPVTSLGKPQRAALLASLDDEQ